MTADRADFGSHLKAAREARGISLRDIAATTKISVLVLEALERNDASRLPGGLFSRAFVRAYAREVGLDPEQTVREFAERFGDATAGEPSEERQVRPLRIEQPEGNHPGVGWLGLIVTVLLVVAWIGVDRYFSRRAEAPPGPARNARAESLPQPAPPPLPRLEAPVVPAPVNPNAPAGGSQPGAGQTPATQPPAAQPGAPTAEPPSATPPAPAPATQPAPAGTPPAAEPKTPTAVLPLRIVVTAADACWVSARVDDQRIPGRTLQPGEKLELSATQAIVLTTGNAGAMSYTINDAPGRSLGAAGQAVTVVINISNYRTFIAGGH